MKSIENYFAKNINLKNTTPPHQQGRFVGKTFSKTSGFTIIEVALVLAIAGLIFLVVFLALPALQNSQKDTALKQDVGRIASALQSIEADNQGTLDATDVTSSSILATTGKLSEVTSFGIGYTWDHYGPNATNHGYVEIDTNPGYRCPTTMPTPNITYSPVFDYTADSSAKAVIVAWLSNGSDYCVSI